VKKAAFAKPRLVHWSSYCAALVLPLWFAGCADQRRLSVDGGTASTQQPHAYRESIDIGGRFSAQFERNDKPEAWNGSFVWAQSPQGTTVTLQSPLGATLATIAINKANAVLMQSGHAPRSAANVDALVEEALGWPLPISNLRDWLQAYAVTADGKRIMATPQLTTTIATRDGWRIRYVSWQDENELNMQNVPKRIDMERDTVEAGKVLMRLVVTSWQSH
jgi:outer membrane lipoprotein LolB